MGIANCKTQSHPETGSDYLLSRAIFAARKTPGKKMSVVPCMIVYMSKCRATGLGTLALAKEHVGYE
jgi:hypothetical protein